MNNKINSIRLELLQKIHEMPEATIHEFNSAYRLDFLALTSVEFASIMAWAVMNPIKIGKVG